MNDYEDPGKKQGGNKTLRESNADTNQYKHTLERDGHQKKHFNVLHDDGSFADLPENEIYCAGAESASITK